MKGIDKKRYGQTILDTRRSFSIFKTPFSTYFSGGATTLRRRLKSVLDTKAKPAGIWLLLLTVALSLVLGDLVALLFSAFVGGTGSLPAVKPVEPPAQTSSSAPPPSSSSQPAVVVPPASSSESTSSEASSSENASSEASSSESSSSEASSSESSSSEASSSESASSTPEKVVKIAGEIPEKRFFLPVIEQIITAYRDGTADTSMLDPTKPVLMPLPASSQNPPEVPTVDTNFNIMRNAQGFGIVLPFDDNAWSMNIWVRDDGPEDAYEFVVTAVSFAQGSRRTASASLVTSAEPEATASSSAQSTSSNSTTASENNAASSYAARKEQMLTPFKRSSSGLLG